jgi:PrsW family intramembrane metalloprotease
MSTEHTGRGEETVPTMPCRICDTDVPAGAFCGLCGGYLSTQRGNGPDWLRIRAYGVAEGEHVLRLSVVSSLFPHLPDRSRAPFRAALAVLLLTLAVFTLLQWQAPLIAVGALGLPLLFLIYLKEGDVFDDLPVRRLLPAALVGVGLGIGWALLTGQVVARTYDVALGSGMAGARVLQEGLAIPWGGAILMLVPVVLARILRPRVRETLDGFVIGALGAVSFTAAATLTQLSPQFATGVLALDRPMAGLMVQAGIRGVALPLIAAAVGGMVGAALWFRTRKPAFGRHRLAALLAGVVTVLTVYAALGLIDIAGLPQALQLVLYLVITVLALLALRIVLQVTLLHEELDEMSPDEPVLCPHCDHVVPDMGFCPNCGAATHASSRSSRTARRLERPVPSDPTTEGP